VVAPGSPLDLDARERGTTLHLPEGAIHLFPDGMTAALGLGLRKISPALSFAIHLGPQGEIEDVRIVPSTVRVTGLTYEQANQRMDEAVFTRFEELALLRKSRREAAGASNIDLPEVKVHVEGGVVQIHPVLSLRSRTIVEEAMILVGEATASYAAARAIPLPFSQQDPPDGHVAMTSPAGMFAMRRLMRRSQYRTTPGLHSGLGLTGYAQATSPLRRYLDLVVHQQLRASLRGEALLGEAEIMERIGAVDAAMPALRQAEQLSERHWTLVYLLQHPGWQGAGVLVEKRAASGLVIIPELALEVRVHLHGDPPLDSLLELTVGGIHLANLDVSLVVHK
jgi:exoribonuclease-2